MCRSSKSGAAINDDVSLTRTSRTQTGKVEKRKKDRKRDRDRNCTKRLSKIENKKKLKEAGDIQILDKTIVKQSDEIRAQYQTILRE